MKTYRVIFLVLAFAGGTLSLMGQRMGVDASQSPFSRQNPASVMNPSRVDNRSISGTIQDTAGNPLPDVRVELTDGSGTVVNSAYTSASGRFEFTRVASGTYLVVATSGVQQASERVDASGFSNMVN